MKRLQDKVVLITGAAGGMGATEAMLFAQEGAKVMATDFNLELLETWVLKAQGEGLLISYAELDVSNHDDWEKVAKKHLNCMAKLIS